MRYLCVASVRMAGASLTHSHAHINTHNGDPVFFVCVSVCEHRSRMTEPREMRFAPAPGN